MKRLTLLTILLVVVGLTAGFAIDVKPTFSLSGSATAKWGVDLITMDHGFNNTADASFTLNLFPEDGTESKGADAPWYGKISFANLEFFWTDAGTPTFGPADTDITAKIIGLGGNLEIGIYAKPSLTYEYAGFVPLFSADDGYDTTGALTPLATIKGGLSFMYKMASIGSFTAKIASNGDWGVLADVAAGDDTYTIYIAVAGDTCDALGDYLDPTDGSQIPVGPLTVNVLYLKLVGGSEPVSGSGNDQYSFGADFSLTAVKDLTFAAGAFYNVETEYLGFGAKAGYTIAGASVNVGFDGVYASTVFSYDLAGSVGYKFMKDKDSISVNVYNDNITDALDVGLLFTDAEGFVPGLSFTLGAYALDLLDTQVMSFAESVSYKFMMGDVNYVKPYEKLCYDLDAKMMYLNVGIETKLIPNTTFKIDFTGGATHNDSNAQLVGTDIADYQVLSVSATVTY